MARESAFQVYHYFVTKGRHVGHHILRNSCLFFSVNSHAKRWFFTYSRTSVARTPLES